MKGKIHLPKKWTWAVNKWTRRGRKYLFSSYSHYATPGCQSHCKISNNLTQLFAFKSLFLTLCKSFSRAEVFFFPLHSVVCSVPPCSPLSAPLGYSSTTWNLSSHRFCLELGQRWWFADFWDFHPKITLEMTLSLKENTCLGPMLAQVRAALLRLCFQRDYPVVFLLFKDSAALDCSRRVLLPLGNCGDNFSIQKFSFPLLWVSDIWKRGLRFAALAPKPRFCPSLWNNQQQSRHLMLKFCKPGFEWWMKWTPQQPQSLEIATRGNVSSAFYRLQLQTGGTRGGARKTRENWLCSNSGPAWGLLQSTPPTSRTPGLSWLPSYGACGGQSMEGLQSKPLDTEPWGSHSVQLPAKPPAPFARLRLPRECPCVRGIPSWFWDGLLPLGKGQQRPALELSDSLVGTLAWKKKTKETQIN